MKKIKGVVYQIVIKLESVIVIYQNVFDDLAKFLEKRKILEKFQFD